MRRDAAPALVCILALLIASVIGLVDIPSPGPIKDLVVSWFQGKPPPAQIGRVKTASGTVSITRGSEHFPAPPGAPVYQADVIETAADGAVGITLVDDSVFSAGPGSRLTLTGFHFDFNTSRGDMLAELRTGTLAVVSGEITHTTPGAMSIKTPSSILGVRGTTFAVEVASGGRCQCVLNQGTDPSAANAPCPPDASSCPPQQRYPEERYVVFPNADGRPGSGAITVNRGSTATTLDQPYAAAELRDGEATSTVIDAARAETIFQQALAARPALPAHFRLNFLLDSDQMTPESQAMLPEVVAEIRKRPVYEVELVGHTDTLADEAYNQKLSRDRALAVRRALVRDGVSDDAISVIARGETELLVPTARGVPEPRNRRVEVSIR